MEKWKVIPGTNCMYWVSNEGRVKSVYKYSDRKGRRTGTKEHILKPSENSMGYLRVSIRINGIAQRCFVHRLVADAFIPKDEGKNIVNHKDFNPHNNAAENLEWVTEYENYRYSFDRGRFKRTDEWKRHLKETLDTCMGKSVIGVNIQTGETRFYRALNDCKRDGFTTSNVSQCCNRKRTKYAGYTWRFAASEEKTV